MSKFHTGLNIAVLLVFCLIWLGYDQHNKNKQTDNPIHSSIQNPGGTTMEITSIAFKHGQPIPRRYTGDSEDISPPLSWTGAPDQTSEFALICDDPDAPVAEPWVHWLIYKIPASCTSLPEAIPRSENVPNPAGACQGRNSWPKDNIGYRGPAPPVGHGVHHYQFVLYALDQHLDLEPGQTKENLLKAMNRHVLSEAQLIGTYQR